MRLERRDTDVKTDTMRKPPSALEMGLLVVKVRGAAPCREAIIKGHVDYELWYETENEENAVKIGDGVFAFGRTMRGNEER